MAVRLTKSQVERLVAALDGSAVDLRAAIEESVAHLHPGSALGDVLRGLGRLDQATLIEAGDEDALWSLATELNELRQLGDSGDRRR